VYQPNHKVWNPKAPCYGRFLIDIPGSARKRTTVPLGICRTPSIARQKLREHLEATGVNSKQSFIENTSPATTFRTQAENWIGSLPTRRRKPVKPATIHGWRHALEKWVLPNIGNMLLSEVSNGALRTLVEKMAAAGLGPHTIISYSSVVKMVVASAVNENGDQLYPRQWNHQFVGLPVLDRTKQRRPTVSAAQIEKLLGSVKQRYLVLFALLAGTGLRIGEALGLKTTDLTDDCTVLHVQRSIWFGQEQIPKTPSAVRQVDLAEPLAKLLRTYTTGKSGYLFSTREGKPLRHRNVLRILYRGSPEKICGLHTFRRFRAAQLRKERVPEDLIKFWLRHARNLTDTYASQLCEDVAFRQLWAERAGLGFATVSNVSNNVILIEAKRVA
jgi:integrase